MALLPLAFPAHPPTQSASAASIPQPALNAKSAITLTLYSNAKLALETALFALTPHSASFAAKDTTLAHLLGMHVWLVEQTV